jgi:3-hydroxyisobutyrate dehydrogenase
MESDMAKLAFCGLGQMGLPMATRLIDAGHGVSVWNRTAEKAKPLLDLGARLAGTPAEAAAGAEAVITVVADPEALEAVVFGAGGLAEALESGATLIDMSTVGPDAVRATAARLPDGVRMLDAPVQGSVAQATEGSLRINVGGPQDLFERWRPLLETLGTPRRFGDLGAGASMKLVMNSTLGAVASALGEALALGDALGLDQGDLLDWLSNSPVGAAAESHRDKIENGTYPSRFKLSLAAKDLRLVTGSARAAEVDMRLAEASRRWLEEADAAGLGDLDYTAVIAHIRGRTRDLV